jgi:uncharacterized membrane protein
VPARYHQIAETSPERLAALSDGIFAVAMTLLVLDLRVPAASVLHVQHPVWAAGALQSEHAVLHVLAGLAPHLLTYLMSFLTLGIFWTGQQTQLNTFTRNDRNITWIQLLFLLTVTFIPFSTALLSEYITYRAALVAYWLNLLLPGAALYLSVQYAARAKLIKDESAAEMRSVTVRRIVGYQVLYAISLLFCVVSTYLSITLIVLVQLNAAIQPPIRPLDRF